MFLVECGLGGGDRAVAVEDAVVCAVGGLCADFGDEAEDFRANFRAVRGVSQWSGFHRKKGTHARDSRGARIGIPARVSQLQPHIHNRLIIQQLAAQNPVPGHETRQMRANMYDLALVVKVRQVSVSSDRGGLLQELDGRVNGGFPSLEEDGVDVRVKTGVFEEVFEVGVRSSTPCDVGSYEITCGGVDALGGESREGRGEPGDVFNRVFGEGAVGIVSRELGECGPFEGELYGGLSDMLDVVEMGLTVPASATLDCDTSRDQHSKVFRRSGGTHGSKDRLVG